MSQFKRPQAVHTVDMFDLFMWPFEIWLACMSSFATPAPVRSAVVLQFRTGTRN
jgi:hypothetical protein